MIYLKYYCCSNKCNFVIEEYVFLIHLFQTPVETSNNGLRQEQEPSLSPAAPDNTNPILRPNTASPSVTSSPPSRHGTPVPDQNSNSVRDLENAMSKHLPKDKVEADSSSNLLKHLYNNRTSLEAVAGENQFLRGGYTSLGPAQPVALKPSLYLDQYSDQSSLYTPSAGAHGFQLYNRGHTWYPNN